MTKIIYVYSVLCLYCWSEKYIDLTNEIVWIILQARQQSYGLIFLFNQICEFFSLMQDTENMTFPLSFISIRSINQ